MTVEEGLDDGHDLEATEEFWRRQDESVLFPRSLAKLGKDMAIDGALANAAFRQAELPGRPMQQPLAKAALQKRDRGRKLQLRVRCSNNLRSLSSVRCPSLPRPPRKRAISRST